jgi:TRAP-type C4-dicarboxylate transport system permease small subunit
MAKIVDGYFSLLRLLIVLCLAAMCVLVFANVVLRYAFNTGITVSEELSRWLFVWMTFLGAIVAMREHGHLGMDSLVARLPVIGKKTCYLASELLMLFGTWLFLQGSWAQTVINLDVTAPASGFSTAWVYGVGVVFGVSVIPIILYDIYRLLSGKMSEEELVMIKESEEQEAFEELQHELQTHGGSPGTVPPIPPQKNVK